MRPHAQANYVFVGCFILEAILKITGLGWRMYWKVRRCPWHMLAGEPCLGPCRPHPCMARLLPQL